MSFFGAATYPCPYTELQYVGAHKYVVGLTANYNNRSELTFDFSYLNLIVCILARRRDTEYILEKNVKAHSTGL